MRTRFIDSVELIPLLLTVSPNVCHATTPAATIRASTRAYSKVVRPRSSRTNSLSHFSMSHTFLPLKHRAHWVTPYPEYSPSAEIRNNN